jgi:hypothetical protein
MGNLHAHANVWETCLQLLERRKYSLRVEIGVDDGDDEPYVYWAERDGFTFSAWNPIELLGLTSIYEDVEPSDARPYWWCARTTPRERRDGYLDDVLKRVAYAKREAREAALIALRADRPAEFRAEVEKWWNEYEGVRDTAHQLGVRTSVLVPWLRELGIAVDRQ